MASKPVTAPVRLQLLMEKNESRKEINLTQVLAFAHMYIVSFNLQEKTREI